MSPFGIRAFLFFVAIGCGFAGVYLHARWLLHDAQRWTPTQSEVIVSKVECCVGKSHATYRLRVAYKYLVGDDIRVGSMVRFDDNLYSSAAEARKLAEAYSVGSTPTVYVDPADSRRSVLDRSQLTEGPEDALGVGIVCGVAGALVGVLLSRTQR